MHKLLEKLKLFLIIIIAIFITSCSSSNYIQKNTKVVKINKPTNLPRVNQEVEEEAIPHIPIENVEVEQKSLVDKIYESIESNNKKEKFLDEIIKFLDTPYRRGGTTQDGFDCSGFTKTVYYNSLNVDLPRTARDQYKINEIFNDKTLLKFGDLVYFNTSNKNFPGHVGIYLNDDLFAHASTSSGVIISSLNEEYYLKRFVGANRVTIKNN
ncbi:MAG: C40 family peptidase [Ignavibacteriae bacterium]|nr:C40 family peptidase [Ignavibacteriota bacterium]